MTNIKHSVYVVDVDGVITKTPSQNTIDDIGFWDRQYNNPDVTVNPEMISLIQNLIENENNRIVFLTARFYTYAYQTIELLRRNFDSRWIRQITPDFLKRVIGDHPWPLLVMRPDFTPAHIWKPEVIKGWLNEGIDVKLMIEDYKPNADAIRAHVPVLLYERKKNII